MDYALEVVDLSKVFGDRAVLHHISVSFEQQKIHGIIGRNGSGKTMLFKCILGLMPFTEGTILINGRRVGRGIDVPTRIGMIIETPGFLPNYSGYENLRYLSLIQRNIGKGELETAMRLVGLDPKSRKWVCKYSMGMRQRLGIAQAIMEDPALLILDEPMNGLDNQGVSDMRKLFLELKARGKTTLLASHNKDDIEALCDHVYEMDAGRLKQLR